MDGLVLGLAVGLVAGVAITVGVYEVRAWRDRRSSRFRWVASAGPRMNVYGQRIDELSDLEVLGTVRAGKTDA